MSRRRQLLVQALQANLAATGMPRVPAGGDLLWTWFIDLSAMRTYHGAGPNPIQAGEVESYFRLRRIVPTQDHLDTLFAMDRAWVESFYAKRGQEGGDIKTMPAPLGEMTGELFDAMWS